MSSRHDPRVDAYIAKAAAFAQPILRHVRAQVHRACPSATETIKWGLPHFEYGGSLLGGMAAFKAHCTFGFWHQGMAEILRAAGAKSETAMGSFGRITSLADLPTDRALQGFVRAAMALTDSGAPARSPGAAPAKPVKIPAELAAALDQNPVAAQTFRQFAPSHRREYAVWIGEAKRPETRARRVATALAWLADGKSRNWKYEKC